NYYDIISMSYLFLSCTEEDLGQSLFKLIENKWNKPFKYKPVTAEQLAHTMVVAALTQIEAFKRYDNLSIQQTR
ncbi:hypothetical protein AAER52_08210, partial [Acinetobacter baumannii]